MNDIRIRVQQLFVASNLSPEALNRSDDDHSDIVTRDSACTEYLLQAAGRHWPIEGITRATLDSALCLERLDGEPNAAMNIYVSQPFARTSALMAFALEAALLTMAGSSARKYSVIEGLE